MMLIAAVIALAGAAAPEGGAMPNEALKAELEACWAGLRSALAEYRLDDVGKYVEVPEGAPAPNRAQAQRAAAELPDLAQARCLKLDVDGDRAGYYIRTDLDKPGTTVAFIVFVRNGGAWKFAPGPLALEIVELTPTGQAALRKLVNADSRFKL
jgi:hypothetical protein